MTHNLTISKTLADALSFAESKHNSQNIIDTNIPYFFHVSSVVCNLLIGFKDSEYNLNLALIVAALHDVVEDTNTTINEIEKKFGSNISDGVQALTKNKNLDKQLQIKHSLSEIRKQPKEIWAVKIADRIVNLSEPPRSWNNNKKINYLKASELIYEELSGHFPFLDNKLKRLVNNYSKYINN